MSNKRNAGEVLPTATVALGTLTLAVGTFCAILSGIQTVNDEVKLYSPMSAEAYHAVNEEITYDWSHYLLPSFGVMFVGGVALDLSRRL